jgi:hypothetical protein
MEIWVPKSGREYSLDSIESVWEAWQNDSPKHEYKVQLEGPAKERWSNTELVLLRAYHFPGHITTSDDSVGTGSMGARPHVHKTPYRPVQLFRGVRDDTK